MSINFLEINNATFVASKKNKVLDFNLTIKNEGEIILISISKFIYLIQMKKSFFKIVAKVNKAVLPSFTKKQLDISKASKMQLVIIGWRAYVTMQSLK